jgi:RNA polymerase sigma-70 factor (ECF subfamily)
MPDTSQSEQVTDANESQPSSHVEWQTLVDKIRRDDASGMEELYKLFSKGMRYYLCRQLGPQDLDDRVHDCFLIVVQAIRRGDLREPERLMGFVRTIVRRQIAGHIDIAVQSRKQIVDLETTHSVPDSTEDPETVVMTREQEQLAFTVLKGISRRDREILTRFYLQEQSQELICREMQLTETQFRLLKSRAKARFGELGKRRLSRRSVFGAA